MGRFEILTKYIEPLKNEKEYGYSVNREGKRVTKEEDLYYYDENNTKVYYFPSYKYSDTVMSFIHDLVNFRFSAKKEEISSLENARTIISSLRKPMVADRFCGGLLLQAFKSGHILKLLERLKEIDESQN